MKNTCYEGEILFYTKHSSLIEKMSILVYNLEEAYLIADTTLKYNKNYFTYCIRFKKEFFRDLKN